MTDQGFAVMPPTGSIDANNVEHVRDIKTAMAKGYRFIKLVHHIDGSITERIFPVEGVRVRRFFDQMTKTNKVDIAMKEGCGCFFVADRDTGIREAFLLDTESNRRMLASHLMENRWRIVDDSVRAEIERIAAALPVDVDTSRMHEQVNMSQAIRPQDVIRSLPPEQREALLAKKRAELEELEQASVQETGPEVAGITNTSGQEFNDAVRKKLPRNMVQAATQKIHIKYASKIAQLRAVHGAKFTQSEDYRKTILPEIDALIAQEMKSAAEPARTAPEPAPAQA